MTKQVLQIENLEAQALLGRLNFLKTELYDLKRELSQKPTPTDLLSRKQVADLFGVSLVTIQDWTKKGILKAYKIANRVYFKRSEVESSLTEIKSGRANR